MKPAILLTVLFFVHSNAFNQKSPAQGYYIDPKGDTVQGKFQKFRQRTQNPDVVEFFTLGNKEIILTPQNCTLFEVKGYDTYIAYKGLRMTNPIEDTWSNVTNSPDTYDTIQAFLKIIYQGNDITIYRYKDKIRENFFYNNRGNDIIELEQRQSIYYAGETRQMTLLNKFRDQLKEEFSDQIEARKLQASLNKLAYTEKDLVRFMDLLHETNTSKKNNQFPAKLFIGTGTAFNSLDITGNSSYHETQINHKSPISPVLIVGAKFYANRNTGRILISPRLRIYSFSSKGDIELMSGTAVYSHESSFKSKLIITPSANLGYNIINHADLKWHTSLGVGYAFLINSKEIQTTKYSNNPPTIKEKDPTPMVFVFNMETGLDIGKNIGIWFNYQPPANATNYVNKSVKFSSFQVGISWSFRASK